MGRGVACVRVPGGGGSGGVGLESTRWIRTREISDKKRSRFWCMGGVQRGLATDGLSDAPVWALAPRRFRAMNRPIGRSAAIARSLPMWPQAPAPCKGSKPNGSFISACGPTVWPP